jgi:hypothetical protein
VFRPRDEENMKLRLETLKACHGQVRERRMREKHDRHRRRLKRTARRAKRIAQFDGPQYAFKDGCSDSFSKTPSILNSSSSDSNSVFSTQASSSTMSTIPEFVDPRLVFSGKGKTKCSDMERQLNPVVPVSPVENNADLPLDGFAESSSHTSANDVLTSLPSEPSHTSSSSQGTASSKIAPSVPKKTQKALEGLLKRITGGRLEPIGRLFNHDTAASKKHIAAVSMFSGASSNGSSLRSWATRMSSSLSHGSTLNPKTRIEREFGPSVVQLEPQSNILRKVPKLKLLPPRPDVSNRSIASPEEIMLLELLGKPRAIAYSSKHPEARPCCRGVSKTCTACGMNFVYLEFTDRSIYSVYMDAFSPDYYANSALHWAGYNTSSRVMSHLLRSLKEENHPQRLYPSCKELASLCNTLGETVLHELQCASTFELDQISGIFELFAKAEDGTMNCINFLQRRDCHGRTIIHRFLLQLSDQLLKNTCFEQILPSLLSMTEIPADAADNQGNTVSDLLLARGATARFYEQIFHSSGSTLEWAVFGMASGRRVTYEQLRWETHILYALRPGSEPRNFNVDWIDPNGDTMLIAQLKYQKGRNLNQLIRLMHSGANISIKDRKGSTALAIAVCVGWLSATIELLHARANVHSRDYAGVGILLQAAEKMRQAKQERDYTMETEILSCANRLIDRGAITNPTDVDEWMTPEGRSKYKAFERSKILQHEDTLGHSEDDSSKSSVETGSPLTKEPRSSPNTPMGNTDDEANVL